MSSPTSANKPTAWKYLAFLNISYLYHYVLIYIIRIILCLCSFIYDTVFEVYPGYSISQYSSLWLGIVFHCIDIPHFFICSLVDGHLFPTQVVNGVFWSLKVLNVDGIQFIHIFFYWWCFFISYFKSLPKPGSRRFSMPSTWLDLYSGYNVICPRTVCQKGYHFPIKLTLLLKNEFTWVISEYKIPFLIGISILYQYHTILVTFAFEVLNWEI